MHVLLIGCASHGFKLEMQNFCESYEPLLQKIQTLIKMTSLKYAAKLRRETNLKPITRNTTRWLPVFAVVERYNELVPSLEKTFAFSDSTDQMI